LPGNDSLCVRTHSAAARTVEVNKGWGSPTAVVKVDRRIRWHYSDYTITVFRFRIGAWQHEVSKLYGTLTLSAGTLMASAGTVLGTG